MLLLQDNTTAAWAQEACLLDHEASIATSTLLCAGWCSIAAVRDLVVVRDEQQASDLVGVLLHALEQPPVGFSLRVTADDEQPEEGCGRVHCPVPVQQGLLGARQVAPVGGYKDPRLDGLKRGAVQAHQLVNSCGRLSQGPQSLIVAL